MTATTAKEIPADQPHARGHNVGLRLGRHRLTGGDGRNVDTATCTSASFCASTSASASASAAASATSAGSVVTAALLACRMLARRDVMHITCGAYKRWGWATRRRLSVQNVKRGRRGTLHSAFDKNTGAKPINRDGARYVCVMVSAQNGPNNTGHRGWHTHLGPLRTRTRVPRSRRWAKGGGASQRAPHSAVHSTISPSPPAEKSHGREGWKATAMTPMCSVALWPRRILTGTMSGLAMRSS